MDSETETNYIHYAGHDAKQAEAAWQISEGKAVLGSLKRPNPETPVQKLERRREDLLKEVARLDELIQLLHANPTTERILQLLGVGV